MRGLLIFDGDDTLWVTEPLYDAARLRASELVRGAGFDASKWDALERSIDVANVDRFGMSRQRFPTSCVEALESLAASASRAVPTELRNAVWDAGSSVFGSIAPLVEGADDVLTKLGAEFRLALLTKGDEEVQRKRIADSGLSGHFGLVRVVHSKDAHVFQTVYRSMGFSGPQTWSVGNSLTSDVLPALEAEMHAIWVDAHVWEYERHAGEVPSSVWIADRLTAVPPILERAAAPTSFG